MGDTWQCWIPIKDTMMFSAIVIVSTSLVSLASGHARANDNIVYFSARLPDNSNKCGPQKPITGWTEDIADRWWSGGTRGATDIFNPGTGIFSTPLRGIYQCCASFRCKQGGVCDFTIRRNANTGNGDVVLGAFGTRGTGHGGHEWETHEGCVIDRVGNNPVDFKVYMESGGSNDCIEDTRWIYSRFWCILVSDS